MLSSGGLIFFALDYCSSPFCFCLYARGDMPSTRLKYLPKTDCEGRFGGNVNIGAQRAQKKRGISSLFLCPGQDSNLHELMLTTPSK